jgi:hypothetical protein
MGTPGIASVNPSLTLLGDVLYSGPYGKQNGTHISFDSREALGGGLEAGFIINETFGISVGAIYVNKSFQQNNYTAANGDQVTATQTQGFVHFPVMLRFYPLRILTIGVGGFYNTSVSKWAVSYDQNGQNFTSDLSNDDLGRKSYDYGAIVSLGLELPVTKSWSLMGDVRLTQSLTSAAQANTDNWQYRDFHVIAGLKFNLGEN